LNGLQKYYRIKKPKIAFLGLNPHCGENGRMGQEEKQLIIPVIQRLKQQFADRCQITGPFPSDTFFANYFTKQKNQSGSKPNAVIALYHDQGLIPVKMLDFDHTVNITLGLPILRSSVDHGTAFDIAYQNKANPSSLISAIDFALNGGL
jgi:4-hydroxythreonine-4-phosphate dehydrogenase